MSGQIQIITGPMFSGKTEELLRLLKRLKYANQTFILFKPEIDTRYSENEVLTHEQVGMTCVPVKTAFDILSFLANCEEHYDVIAIDEGQFFSENDEPYNLYKVARILKSKGYRVIINGLDMDFMGDPFPIMPQLMSIADKITKLTSICCICHKEGTMTYRIAQAEKTSAIVELGSNDKYQAMCYKHWLEKMKEHWHYSEE